MKYGTTFAFVLFCMFVQTSQAQHPQQLIIDTTKGRDCVKHLILPEFNALRLPGNLTCLDTWNEEYPKHFDVECLGGARVYRFKYARETIFLELDDNGNIIQCNTI